jgi:hypothetical protein
MAESQDLVSGSASHRLYCHSREGGRNPEIVPGIKKGDREVYSIITWFTICITTFFTHLAYSVKELKEIEYAVEECQYYGRAD